MEKLRRTVSVLLCIIISLGLLQIFQMNPVNAQELQEVTIYELSSQDSEIITIPQNYPVSYQIPITGSNVKYKVTSGSHIIQVSDQGMVTAKRTYWKRYSNYSQSVSEGEDYDYYTINTGDAEVLITDGGQSSSLTVHVTDYSKVYFENVMQKYIADNVKEGMSDDELAEVIVKFPASYDYDYRYSSAISMVMYGGGDCWASTDAIIRLAEKMGYKAWSRNGRKDPGAGSGHMNAMVQIHDNYYELEAGYASDKTDGYRPYNVKRRTTLLSYYTTTNNEAIVYQYDGQASDGELVIPEEINGKKVTALSKSALAGTNFTKITLPDTLQKIGDYAFSGCSKLETLKIPASVSAIGGGIFASCKSLTNASLDSGNPYYKVQDKVIYTKDGTELITTLGAEKVTVPSTVTKIQKYAFYYNDQLKEVAIPSSVTTLEEGCFGNASNLSKVVMEEGVTTIGAHCFRYDSQLQEIQIPKSVAIIHAFAFSECSGLERIYFTGDAPVFGSTIDGNAYDKVFNYDNRLKAYYPEDNTTWNATACSDHGGKVTWYAWDGKTLKPEEGTTQEPAGTTQEPGEGTTQEPAGTTQEPGEGTTQEPGEGTTQEPGEGTTQEPEGTTQEPGEGTTQEPGEGTTQEPAGTTQEPGEGTTQKPVEATQKPEGTTQKPVEAKKGRVFQYDNAIYKITGEHTVEFWQVIGNKTTITIPNSVIYEKVKYKVTAIAPSACARKTAIVKVTIGKNVSKIGARAFYHCRKLKSVTIYSRTLLSKKVGKNAWKGIAAKAVFNIPVAKKQAYKKWIGRKGAGNKIVIKARN